jgi:hypothetical protein
LDRDAARYFEGSMSLEETALFEAQVRHAVATKHEWVLDTADDLVEELEGGTFDPASVQVCRRLRFLDSVGRSDAAPLSLGSFHREACDLCRSLPRHAAVDDSGRVWSIVIGVILFATLVTAIVLLGTGARAPAERTVQLADLPLDMRALERVVGTLQTRSYGGDHSALEDIVLRVMDADATYLDRIVEVPSLRVVFDDMGLTPNETGLKTRLALLMAILQDTRLVPNQQLVALELIQELTGERGVPFLMRMAESARDDVVFNRVVCRLFDMEAVAKPGIVARHLIGVALDRGFTRGAKQLLMSMMTFTPDEAVPVAFSILEGQGQLGEGATRLAAGFVRERMRGLSRRDLIPRLEQLLRVGSQPGLTYSLLILNDTGVPGDWASQLSELEVTDPKAEALIAGFRSDYQRESGPDQAPESETSKDARQPGDSWTRGLDPKPLWR